MTTKKPKKKDALRYNEYYDTQVLFDDLYAKSKRNYCFRDLVSSIKSEQNILLAYRKIKRNRGSLTAGIDGKTIKYLAEMPIVEMVKYFQGRIDNYSPQNIRRVEIPKSNGKKRPLGIPTIEDRLIQQCIKQILEPIAEAKFHPHSYGFRPNRSAHHAIARAYGLINTSKLYYVVDVDIKGFFDNVNHAKLLKQMWSMGIRDKNLFCIIKKMLSAEVAGIGIPKSGTPQGGILSPLLSNIVLNELDWWISNQWETFKTRKEYKKCGGAFEIQRLYTELKEMRLVRYADDFKIFCRDYKTAKKVYIAVEKWLKERLHLDISDEKSKITNLRKKHTEFLGFKIKAIPRRKQCVVKSHVSEKAKSNSIRKIKTAIYKIKKNTTMARINQYNSTVLGLHNYFRIATMVSQDFYNIAFQVRKYLYNKLKSKFKKHGQLTNTFKELYGNYKYRIHYIMSTALFPINGIKSSLAYKKNQSECNYTLEGRKSIHRNLLHGRKRMLEYLMSNPVFNQTTEYNDNRLSLYVGQAGKCALTKQPLTVGNMDVHHIIPKNKNGTDAYKNLIFICADVHKLIHAKEEETVAYYRQKLMPTPTLLAKINELRTKVGNYVLY